MGFVSLKQGCSHPRCLRRDTASQWTGGPSESWLRWSAGTNHDDGKNLRKWWNMRLNHVKPAKWWLLYEYFMVPSGISSNHSNLGTGRSLIFIDDFPSKPRFISGIFQRATFVFCGAVKSWIYPSVDHDISGTKITMNRTKNCPICPINIWDIMVNMGYHG